MLFNLTNNDEAEKAHDYLYKLMDKGATVEVKEKRRGRSIPQNSYLHLLLGIAGMEWGYTIEEFKTIWKRDFAPSIFFYEKNGNKFLRSSADLDIREMTDAIDILRNKCAENGLYLPEANEEEKLRSYQNMLEQSGQYFK